MILVRFIVLLLLFAYLSSGHSYAQQKPLEIPRESRTTPVQAIHRVPFELYGGRIYLRVRVNNSEPRPFILDTGAQIAHLRKELAQTAGLRLRGSLGVTGTGAGRIKAHYVAAATYNVSGAEFIDERSIALPTADFFQPLENSFGREFDGVLGYNIFHRFVVEIDYANQMINLYDPASYRYAGSGEVVPIRINDKKPYITATLTPIEGIAIQSNLHIDTGFGGGLSFNANFVRANNLLQSARTTIESFNRGAGGETATRVGRVKSLQFGRFTILNPTASFALEQGRGVRSDSAGRIGGGTLQRFKVVLDYSRKQMILEPNANFNEPYEADMSGISLVAEKPDYKTFVVYKLTANSPATQAGVRTGDVILNVDSQPTSKFTLEQIREMFKQVGQERLLRVKRGNEMLEIQIKLRRLI
jgi:hypothetical protein